ncbi:MAG: hypothetical protein ACI9CD_000466 [Candidatus Deianiraeaceae bacterium]|jgi:hypothetical protein
MIDFINQLTPQALNGMLGSCNNIEYYMLSCYKGGNFVIAPSDMNNIFSNTEKITLLCKCADVNTDVLQCLVHLTNEQCQLINKVHNTTACGVHRAIVSIAKCDITADRDVIGNNLQAVCTELQSGNISPQLHGRITHGKAL